MLTLHPMAPTTTMPGGAVNTPADDETTGNGTGTIGDGVAGTDEDDHDPAPIGVNQTFDLALFKTLASGQASAVAPGADVTFTISVVNQGTLDAYDIDVIDYIPTGLSLNDLDWTASGSNAVITIDGPLTPGDTTTVDITLTVDADFMGTSLTNFAEINDATDTDGGATTTDDDSTPDGTDNNDAGGAVNTPADDETTGNGTGTVGDGIAGTDEDDHDPSLINVNQTFDLALFKTLASGQASAVAPGADVTFSISVVNQGTLDAYDIDLIDYIPTGLTLNDVDWTASGATAAITIDGPLTPGDTTTVDITFTVDAGFMGASLTNFAEITDATDTDGGATTNDDDSTPDGTDNNDAGGQVGSPADDETTGDGTGTVGDGVIGTDEDDHDPAQVGVSPFGIINGIVCMDNCDGVINDDDSGIANVTVDLIDSNGDTVDTQVSGLDGNFSFTSILPGIYTVAIDNSTLSGSLVLTAGTDPVEVNVVAAVTDDVRFCYRICYGAGNLSNNLYGYDLDAYAFVSLDVSSPNQPVQQLDSLDLGHEKVQGMTYDPVTNYIYITVDLGDRNGELRRIDPVSFTTANPIPSELVGSLPNASFDAIDIHPLTGELYAIDSRENKLAIIDKSTAAVTYISQTDQDLLSDGRALSFAKACVCDTEVELYSICDRDDVSKLTRIDVETGEAVLVTGNEIGFSQVKAIAFGPSSDPLLPGTLYGYASGGDPQYITIDLNTGIGSTFSDNGTNIPYHSREIQGLFFCPANVSSGQPIAPVSNIVFSANESVTIKKPMISEGNIHANREVVIKPGAPTSITCDIEAGTFVTVQNNNTVNGKIVAGGKINLVGNAVVTGDMSDNTSVSPVVMPTLAFTAGGINKKVPAKGNRSLAPGSYDVLKIRKRGTLNLSAGEYFFNELRAYRYSNIHVDVSAGPVTINVVGLFKTSKRTEIIVTPAAQADKLTINLLTSDDTIIMNKSVIMGTINAPNSSFQFLSNSRFKGTVNAKSIWVGAGVQYFCFATTASLAKVPWTAEERAEFADDQDVSTTIVTDYELEQNYPNPFNPTTTIKFALPEASGVSLRIFSQTGQLVKVLVARQRQAGRHEVQWNGTNVSGTRVASGIYFYRLTVRNQDGDIVYNSTGQMSFLK